MVITDALRRRALINDLLIGVGIPILQILARECLGISRPPVVYRDAIQSMLFRRIATTYLKILVPTPLW